MEAQRAANITALLIIEVLLSESCQSDSEVKMCNYIHRQNRCFPPLDTWSVKSELLLLIFIAVYLFFYLTQFYISNFYIVSTQKFPQKLLALQFFILLTNISGLVRAHYILLWGCVR